MQENQSKLNTPPPNQFNATFGFNLVSIPGISTPFACRPINEDLGIANSIFGFQEYLFPIENFQPKLILDCGGNIGCAAVYFANKYPDAQIYSVEPEKNNFKLLKFNTAFYENIHPINSALWDKETFIRIGEQEHFNPLGFMTFETTADDPDAFKTTTVAKLLAESGFDEIDLLKVDIEGAEKEVFSAPDVDSWLPKVKVLTIELHDRMKRGCSYELFKAVSKYKWFFAFRGENLIFIREELIT
ncbi:MAG: FkbM family methyltransferase [Selenomonadaceae bacterium]|nr:FkbM family methyltransferase [Selenomonadaceae bacterium]